MLKVVGGTGATALSPAEQQKVYTNQAYEDHSQLIEGYLRSHKIRNHSEKTIQREKRFLESWFEEHGPAVRPLFTWEAMEPVIGRKRTVDYGNSLIESGLSSDTVHSYLGALSRYFAYVLEHPYLERSMRGGEKRYEHIQNAYGPIDQPISEYDMPVHVYDGERLGVPLDPENLYQFYGHLRKYYLPGTHASVRARNYSMAVLAGESGLRVDELLHLKKDDLFFESNRVQTRYAKGTRGSGKRARCTLFPPLARDTLRYYLKEHRPNLEGANKSSFLFTSKSGRPLSYGTAHRALEEMCTCARHVGFSVADHMSWHWFRRVFATRFIEQFPNKLSVLLNLLGHVSPASVHRYIRHSEAWMDREIQNVLERSEVLWASNGS